MSYVPSGWGRSELGDLCQVVRGSSPRPAGDTRYFLGSFLPWITVGEITRSNGMYLCGTETFLTEEGAKHTRILKQGTLVLTNSGATLGIPKILSIEGGANDGIAAFLDLDESIKQFVYFFLYSKTKYFRDSLAPGIGQPNLNTELIGSVLIPLPPKEEALTISETLYTWVLAGEKLESLIVAKEKHKRGLMQQLLTGSRRLGKWRRTTSKRVRDQFGNYPVDWKRCAIGELVEEVSARAGNEFKHARVLSSTKHHGLVPSDEYFGRKVHSDDTSNYKVVKRGDFAYATNHIDEGSIGRQMEFEVGLVSPIYTVFRVRPLIDSNFLNHMLKSPLMLHHYGANTSASVDRRGSLRYNEFAKIHVWVPSKEEQSAISEVLTTAVGEIRLLNRLKDALTKQKQGLMQKLLTGAIRVKTDKEEA